METIPIPILILISSMIINSYAQTCSTYSFSTNKIYDSCHDLPNLSSFLHYTYNSSGGGILDIAFRQTGLTSSQWAAWAINPKSSGMVGSQALVAYPTSDGTVKAYTCPISGYRTSMEQGELSFDVSDLSATYSNNEIIIYATLGISKLGKTVLNQVWQQGPVSADTPAMHPTSGPNLQSMGTIDLLSGASAAGQGNDKLAKRNTHGVLNAVSWGVMMPIGALTARYLKVIKPGNPTWFYLHVSCQCIAYIVGVAGWGTGLKLGSESAGVQFNVHRNIGITLFVLGTLQVFALLLRPKPDHKLRFYWNMYHHSIGYTTILLSIVNIFKGFSILNPEQKWKDAYIVIVVVLCLCAAALEGVTWYLAKRRKSEEKTSQGYGSTA
ncbi:cytochrome b561 and DOMON domain-containing protein At5g47530 [Euphorbia lathyris]|uniref:cytochrome b561 and DOMON domain-containing protein At5g47530 n=1 Tax=Euphorbia lathyris TaxID=212925 RepID=UPI003313C0AB